MKRHFTVRKLGRAAEKTFLAGLVALMTHYAATKNTGVDGRGRAAARRGEPAASQAAAVPVVGSASGGAYAHDLAPGETFGPLAFPTGFMPVAALSFFDFASSPTGVWLGAAWAHGARPSGGRFGVWGAWRLASDAWAQVAAVDAADAVSNFAAFVDWPSALSELVGSGAWPTNADGSAGFFRLLPDAADERDSDGDDLTDAEESLVYFTDPNCADTDGDGDPDGWEVDRRLDPRVDEPGLDWTPAIPDGASAAPRPSARASSASLRADAGGNGADALVTYDADGWPQIERDDTHPAQTFVFSWRKSWIYVPPATGTYTFTLAADDDATLSVGGSSVSVTWPGNHGQLAALALDLRGGVGYAVEIDYANSRGGAYFLTTGVTPGGRAFDPRIDVDPREVFFSLKMGDAVESRAACPVLSGSFDPNADYTVGVTLGAGLASSGGGAVSIDGDEASAELCVFPDRGSAFWTYGETNRATATFVLYADGEAVGEASAEFVQYDPKEDGCGCCGEGTEAKLGCVSFSQRFGAAPQFAGIPSGRVVVRAGRPVRDLWTPGALRFDHPMMRRVLRRHNLDAAIVDGLGAVTEYRRGLPHGHSAGLGGHFFRDGDGAFVESLPDGLRVVYSDDGAAVALQPVNGARIPVDDLGVALERTSEGTLAAVSCPADGRMSAVATGANSWRLEWTSPTGGTVKIFEFGGDGERVFTLCERRGGRFRFDCRWTYDDDAKDWIFERAPGTSDATEERRTLEYDPATETWNETKTTVANGVAVAGTASVLADGRHRVAASERRDAVTGRLLYAATVTAAGRVAQETDERGLVTRRAYDEWGRVTGETSVDVDNALTNVVTCAYAPADHGAVERRPVTRTTSLNGETLLEESFAYATNALGGAIILRQCATAGGTPRVSYEEYDACARLTLTVREDGRASRIAYGEPDGYGAWLETEDEGVIEGWGEMVAALAGGEVPSQPSEWSQLSQSLVENFALVPGKSTREIRAVSAQGDVIRRESHALPQNRPTFKLLNLSTATYSPTHKPIFTAYGDGTTEAADWICPGPVWQTSRDGVTVSNEYSGAKLLAATTRYGVFGPVTTRYDRDAAGRIIRETTDAPNCETQTVTRTYDSRGRVTSETDAQGRTTTTAYSDDDRVTTTAFADGGTRIVTRNADGTLASITGTAVTPEYHTYGVEVMDVGGNMVGRGLRSAPSGESMPVRVHEIRYGRTDSPRFTRTYTDGFGDVIREERSGANGATLVTENAYDAFGRLIATAETAQPLVAYEYDAWGDRIAQTQSADDEWRLAETETATVVADDGEVWRETMATRSCSDAAIAPLVTAQRTRLSGLTLATNAVTITTDVRGNETVTTTTLNPATQSSHETTLTPGVLNVATNWYTDGVMVSNISHSGVLSQTRRDAMRRETARIDGRGNTTRTEYDALGRVAATIDALTNATTYAYDAMNRVAAITNALGDATIYEYDHRGNKTYEGGATYPVRYTYDEYGNRTTMTTYRREPEGGGRGATALPETDGTTVGRGDLSAPSGDTTTWLYDEASGVMTNKLYADGKGPRYTYTDDGKLATRTWARGIVTTYAYDGWNNLTNTSYSDDTPTVTVDYDALGRQVEARDAAGVTTFAYDAYGANTNEAVIGVAGTNVIERFTDAYGRDAGYALNGARRTIIGRDPATGRIETMLTAGCTNAFRWTYHPGSDLKHTLCYPNGALVTWEYEPCRNLMTLVSNDVYSTFRYAYDEIGKRVAKNDENYEYNFRGELIFATNIVTGSEFAYGYDDIGNRLWSREFGTNCAYVANELNQYTNIVRGGVFEKSSYDLDGNQTNVITSTGEWEVKYNGENRPVRWGRATDGIAVRMCYDRMGRRVVKNNEAFFYDNYLNVGMSIWDPTEPVATRPLVQFDGNSTRFCFHDGNKNVVNQIESIDNKSDMSNTEQYTPFGGGISIENASTWLFSSEYIDSDLGVYYYVHRFYAPSVGRWCSFDPVNEEAFSRFVEHGDFDFSSYIYVKNSPADETDELGLKQVGQVKCGACNICLDYDGGSGDGNQYKIHWVCSSNGRTPSTCRGGDSAQFPSYEPSHGSKSVPPSVKKCIKDKTRWEKKTIKLSVPIPNTKCCKNEEYTSWIPSTSGMSMSGSEATALNILTCAGIAIVVIMLIPAGI